MKLMNFKVLTFDCYGTLIDWETGILNALRPWLAAHSLKQSNEEILSAFALYETEQQKETPESLYPEILSNVHKSLAKHWNIPSTLEDQKAFSNSVKDWPAFPDTAESLRYLKQHYKLVILSNIDKNSFKASNKKLGVEFDAIYTAEEIGTYKPDLNNFKFMLSKLAEMGFSSADILHTAQSLYHDHVPATHLGLATCWVNRRNNQLGSGATPVINQDVKPNFTVNSLAELVDLHQLNLGQEHKIPKDVDNKKSYSLS